MGRAPCCDKANVKKGPWSPEEDARLKAYIEQYGTGGNWIALPQKMGLKRCGKSCRLRWLNYLRPNIKHGGFSEEEENIICSLYISIGSRWSIIASQLPGRTDNDIKNYWNTSLKKKLLGKHRKEQQALARRINYLKQEINKDNENFIYPSFVNQTPYWPDHHQPLAVPVLNSNQDQLYENSGNMVVSSTALSSNQLIPSVNYDVINGGAPTMFQGLENFQAELQDLADYLDPQQFDGLMEDFYGMDHMNMMSCSRGTSSSAESSSWGDMSSLQVDPPLIVSDYDTCKLQGMPQDSAFDDELRYYGLQ